MWIGLELGRGTVAPRELLAGQTWGSEHHNEEMPRTQEAGKGRDWERTFQDHPRVGLLGGVLAPETGEWTSSAV